MCPGSCALTGFLTDDAPLVTDGSHIVAPTIGFNVRRDSPVPRPTPAARLQSLAGGAADGDYLLDLSGVSWLDPLHLVGVAAVAQLAAVRGSRLRLRGLRATQAGYASRMHLGAIVERFGGSHDLPTNGRELDRS